MGYIDQNGGDFESCFLHLKKGVGLDCSEDDPDPTLPENAEGKAAELHLLVAVELLAPPWCPDSAQPP